MIKKITKITAIMLSLCLVIYLLPSGVFSVLVPSYKDPEAGNANEAKATILNEIALEALPEVNEDAKYGALTMVEADDPKWYIDTPMDGVLRLSDLSSETSNGESVVSFDIEPAEETEENSETEVSAVTEETETIEEETFEEMTEAIDASEETAEEFERSEEPLATDAAAETETIDETETQVEIEAPVEVETTEAIEVTDAAEVIEEAKETESADASERTEATEIAETEAEKTEPEPETEIPVPIGISATYIGSKYVGETMTASDLVVAVTLSNGSVLTNPEGFTAYPLELAEENEVVVSYREVACTLRFTAPQRPVLKITATPANQVAERSTKLSVTNEIKIEYTGPTIVGTPIDPDMLICYVEAGIDRYYAGTYSMTAQSDVFLSGINPLTVTLNDEVYTLNVIAQEANPYGICSDGFDREDAVEVFRLQNEMRIAAGRKPLLWSEELYLLASERAAWAVLENGAISHNGKLTTGENCFSGPLYGSVFSAEYKIDAYSKSKAHKNTILKAKYEFGAVSTYYGVSYSVFETSDWYSRLADAILMIRNTKGVYIPCE